MQPTTLTQEEVSQMLVTSFQLGWMTGLGSFVLIFLVVTACMRKNKL